MSIDKGLCMVIRLSQDCPAQADRLVPLFVRISQPEQIPHWRQRCHGSHQKGSWNL